MHAVGQTIEADNAVNENANITRWHNSNPKTHAAA